MFSQASLTHSHAPILLYRMWYTLLYVLLLSAMYRCASVRELFVYYGIKPLVNVCIYALPTKSETDKYIPNVCVCVFQCVKYIETAIQFCFSGVMPTCVGVCFVYAFSCICVSDSIHSIHCIWLFCFIFFLVCTLRAQRYHTLEHTVGTLTNL